VGAVVRRPQRGFTLVELMVALTLFGLLVSGVLSIAVSMGQGFREQRQVEQTDTSVRAPMDYIIDAIRQASPGVPTGNIFLSNGDTTCGSASVTVGDGSGANGTDTLDVIYASGGVVTTLTGTAYANGTTAITVVDTTGISPGDTLVISNITGGVVVYVATVPSGTQLTLAGQSACATSLLTATPFPAGSIVVRALRAHFFVGPDPQLGANNPMLFIQPYTSAGPGTAQALADNVEDLQIAQGVDTDNNQIITSATPDEWEYSASLGSAGGLVGTTRALRITLISRSPTPLFGDPAPGSFQRPQAEDHGSGSSDSYRRRVLTSVAEIRNMVGSP
jgi:prepilin-type N-terminal cleavage/methylation domain-containing protein